MSEKEAEKAEDEYFIRYFEDLKKEYELLKMQKNEG